MERLRANSMAWLERTNPLRGLSISRAGAIFDNARVWGSPRLQYMYNEIEMTDPVLMTCVERRNAALAGLQQQFVAIAGSDEVLADEQRDALARFANGIDNFGDTLERMDEAFFRGYCHVQPIWDGATVPHVNFLNSWNFMRDDAGRWLWNPKCHETIAGLDDVRGARLVSLVRRRAIDYPAIFIYIRKALGERDYGRFIERHGIPHAAIMMAPGTEKKDVPQYLSASGAWSNGQDVVLPNGASIDLATDARGTDPFTPFVEHQDKYIVLLATGGTLTSLAQADTGSLAGGAQMEVWREIVARDGVLIADALNRGLFRRYLEMAFPGRPVCAEFRLDNEKKASAAEVADLAGKLKAAGWRIDQGQLEEAVGYTLERDDGGALAFGGADGSEAVLSGRFIDGRARTPASPFMNKAKDLPAPAGQSEAVGQRQQGQDAGNSSEDVLKAFARDTGPAADAIQALLNNPSKEAAEALLADLPSLLPDDPALAAVIAEEMAKQFAVDGRARTPAAPLENKDDANGVSHSDADGKFDGGNGGGAPNGEAEKKEHPKGDSDDLGPNDTGDGLSEPMKKCLKQGQSSVEKVLSSKADVMNAMSDPELGEIDFRWSGNRRGIKHIIERRNAYKANHPEAPSGEDIVRKIPSIIARGERKTEGKGLRADTIIVYKKHKIILTPSFNDKPSNRWVLSEYDINPDAAGYRTGRKSRSGANGEGVNSSAATHQKPTRASSSGGSASK